MDRKEIGALTGLRGIAALWVFLVHAANAMRSGSPELTTALDFVGKAGYLGVDIFFVLSGFVLALNYADKDLHRSAGRYGEFLWKRLARIYPVHIATLGLLIVLTVGFQAAGSVFVSSSSLSIDGMLAQVTLTHAWTVPAVKGWNAVSWSISAEWAAYLVFPLIVVFANKLKSQGLLLAVIGAIFIVLWYLIEFGPHQGTVAYAIPRIAAEFSAGVLLHRLWVLRDNETSRYGDALAMCSLIAMIGGATAVANALGWDRPLPYAPILACGIVYGLVIGRGSFNSVLSTPAALFAGRISYAFYMVHVLMLEAGVSVLQHFGTADADRWIVAAIIASFAATLAVATFLYYRVEEPARRAMCGWRKSRALGPAKWSPAR